MKRFNRMLTLVAIFVGFQALAIQRHPMRSPDAWLQSEVYIAKQKLVENISPAGAAKGVVIASPQKADPNYFRHWVRDAALVMKVVVELSESAQTRSERRMWESMIQDFVRFSRQNQLSQTLVGLGEVIFEVNGQPFLGPWGRPQNDGPALRAIALIQWAHILLDRGQTQEVRNWLYDSALPARTVIKADLEYVSHHWQDASFDVWEETKGDHFFTRMAQKNALLAGSYLADRLNDSGAAAWYRDQARRLDQALAKHWSDRDQILRVTLNQVEGADYKDSGLDTAVLIGILRAPSAQFPVNDARVVSTFRKYIDQFSALYSVNRRFSEFAPALGRYPEDLYAGAHFNGGNPWVLTTLYAAEYCFKMSSLSLNSKSAAGWFEKGDSFIQRVQFHANGDGSLSEQIDKDSGFMTSAADLTWNYAAVLTAAKAREHSLKHWGRKGIHLVKK